MSASLPEKKHESSSTPIPFFSEQKLKHSDIKKRVYQRLRKDDYDGLREDWRFYSSRLTSQQISAFFSKEGSDILMSALIYAENDVPLKFWIEIAPEQVLKILSKDDFSLFRLFLKVQVGLEEYGWDTEETNENQIKKFKVLLKLDHETFLNFMKENEADESMISEQIVLNFNNALLGDSLQLDSTTSHQETQPR